MKPVVLLVENDEALLDVLGELMARLGYEVYSATSTLEGLRIFRERRIDFCLADIGRNGNGLMLAANIRAINPLIAILLMSGMHPDNPAWMRQEKIGFLLKPFNRTELCIATAQSISMVSPSFIDRISEIVDRRLAQLSLLRRRSGRIE